MWFVKYYFETLYFMSFFPPNAFMISDLSSSHRGMFTITYRESGLL